MASEPAEPTTRQEELIEKAGRGVWQSADGIHLAVEAEDGELEWLECDPVGGWLLRGMLDMVPDEWERLAPVGLLADPAQTTELEELREQAANAFADTAKLHGMYAKGGTMHLEIEPPHALVLAWVGAARAMLDDAPNYCETRVDAPKVEMEIKAAGELDRYAFTIQRVGKVTPHEARRKAEAERDALSLLLRGMARKLAAYRRWTSGETPTIHKLFDSLRAEASSADDVTMSAIRLMNRAGAERDQRQARIEAALAKLNASDQATSWEAMYGLVVEAKTILRGWASTEPAGEAIPVEELRRAVLVGDQLPTKHCQYQVPPGTEPEENGLCIQPATDGEFCGTHAARLSGAALRAVEEADDAAGDLP